MKNTSFRYADIKKGLSPYVQTTPFEKFTDKRRPLEKGLRKSL